MSNEIIKPPNNTLAPTIKFAAEMMYVKFSGSCLKQDKITFNHGKTVNIYIVYDLKPSLNNFDPTLQNCLFGAIKLTKNSDIDKLINVNMQDMELNLIQKESFHIQVVELV